MAYEVMVPLTVRFVRQCLFGVAFRWRDCLSTEPREVCFMSVFNGGTNLPNS